MTREEVETILFQYNIGNEVDKAELHTAICIAIQDVHNMSRIEKLSKLHH